MAILTRRRFLVGGAIVGGVAALGVAVGVGLLSAVDTTGLSSAVAENGDVQLNAWVGIRTDGKIILAVPRTEMGQGVHTALAMLIAEELEISLTDPDVVVEHPTANLAVYTNFLLTLGKTKSEASGATDWLAMKGMAAFKMIQTGGSTSVVDAFDPYRLAGAAARTLLIQAAAARWSVAAGECAAQQGRVFRRGSAESFSYQDLAADAARGVISQVPALKPLSAFKIIGQPVRRLDIPAKTNGTALFAIDVTLPGMVYATIAHCPIIGGRIRAVDSAAAKAVPGVISVVMLDNAVGVIARGYYEARRGADALVIECDPDPGSVPSSALHSGLLSAALAGADGHVFRDDGHGDPISSADPAGVVEAAYEVPFLAHACMEPMNATALFKDGTLDIWAGTQSPTAMAEAARRAVPAATNVIGHVMLTGGGFGRRLDIDVQTQVAQLAAAMPGRPVKLIWSREEDIRHDFFRPAAVSRCRGVLGEGGLLQALDTKVALQSVNLQYTRRNHFPVEIGGPSDAQNVDGINRLKYSIPNTRITAATIESRVPVGYWRSVGTSQNVFFLESFLDELAHAAKLDPVRYRRTLLGHDLRMAALVDRLEQLGNWAAPAAEGGGRGIALHWSRRSLVGLIARVVADRKKLRIEKITCVVDCGLVVNPDTVRAQMEGGIIFALSALAYGEISLAEGRIEQSNFHDHPILSMAACPEIEVHIMASESPPGGIGELAVAPTAPAVTNAIFAATGERIRRLPLTKSGFSLS